MRSIPPTSTAKSPEAASTTRADVVSVTSLTLLLAIAVSSILTVPRASFASPVCHTVDEVVPAFFAHIDIASYDFTGAEADQLRSAIDALGGHRQTSAAAAVRLVVIPEKSEFDLFFFGSDSCNTFVLRGLDYDDVANVFTIAKVSAPDGLRNFRTPSQRV